MFFVDKYINSSKLLISLCLATLGLFLIPKSAEAFSLVNRTNFSDTDFQNLLEGGKFTELFVAESRIGNNSLDKAERELGINRAIAPNDSSGVNNGDPVVTGDRVWNQGQLVNFSLEYTGDKVTYTVDNQILTSNNFSGSASDIFLRTFASNNGIIELTNLALDGQKIGDLSSSSINGSSDTDYIQISNISAPFKLTGQSLLNWTGSQTPQRSQLAYQIKVGKSIIKEVPEPSTVAAILLATVAGVSFNQRKKKALF
jgi:hypothetical protein